MQDSLDQQLTSADSLQSSGEQSSVQISFVSPTRLIDCIKKVVSDMLEDNGYIHPSLVSLLTDPVSKEKLKKFITDSQLKSIQIQRSSSKGFFST